MFTGGCETPLEDSTDPACIWSGRSVPPAANGIWMNLLFYVLPWARSLMLPRFEPRVFAPVRILTHTYTKRFAAPTSSMYTNIYMALRMYLVAVHWPRRRRYKWQSRCDITNLSVTCFLPSVKACKILTVMGACICALVTFQTVWR